MEYHLSAVCMTPSGFKHAGRLALVAEAVIDTKA